MTGKTILIIGFTRRTSYAAARVLLKLGNTVILSDTSDGEDKKELVKELKSLGNSIDLLGNQSPGILKDYHPDLVMPSPGVPLTIPLIKAAKEKNIPVLGDIELFYQFFPDNFIIGITGTDGKTTTTTLVHSIISAEKHALIGGNVGIPVFEHYDSMTKNTILVLELSSFQLEAIQSFRPKAAAILNIAEDHLDRYNSMESYMLAKKNIFKNQGPDCIAVLNLDNFYSNKLRSGIHSRVLTFSRNSDQADIYFKDNSLFYEGKKYIERQDIKLKGAHNTENAMAAILLAKSAGISDQSIRKVLSEFEGLEHRLEFVRAVNGVEFYNDSKSTTVNSLEKALLSFDQPVILIAGGRDKGLDFTKIKELASRKLKELVLIGEASGKIKKELDFEPSYQASGLEDAVRHAMENAAKDDVVVLSPGCASFDMFKNYEERGKAFKEIVNRLS